MSRSPSLDLPRLDPDPGEPAPALPPVRIAAFSDDLEPSPGRRLRLPVVLTDRGDPPGYRVDFRDCPELDEHSRPFAVDRSHVAVAVALAFNRALGLPARSSSLLSRLELSFAPRSWIGADADASDPLALAMSMARIYDAVQGALASVWRDRVPAGSCSLGAVVELRSDELCWREVVPGGEGGSADRDGASAWPGPILPPGHDPVPAWLQRVAATRSGSGGVGARNGGDGSARAYLPRIDLVARVALDRRNNPPHGLDRAGPPRGSNLRLVGPEGETRTVEPWEPFTLPTGWRLEVETAGGAGHGFPGYGEIEFDPDAWQA